MTRVRTCPSVFSKITHGDMDAEDMLEFTKGEKGVPK